jgi:dTMP kinase
MVQHEVKPGLTLIFTVPVEVSRERLSKTGKIPDKFEGQNEEFFLKAIEGYHARAVADPERCKLIDSSKGLDYTEQQVIKIMNEYFAKFNNKNTVSKLKK